MKKNIALAVAALISAMTAPAAIADVVRLAGSVTVANAIVNPFREGVEKKSGHTLEVVSSASPKGLIDLVDGKADASMASEPLEMVVEAAAGLGKQVDIKTLQFHEVQKDEIVFVTHPSNPVSSLTWDQIRDIHTGKITNWKEVGGKDLPINVYLDVPTGATRSMIKKIVMGGQDYSASGKTQINVKRVGEVVANDEAGFGGLGKSLIEGMKVKVVQSKKIERPLGFVTVGAPSAKVDQVITAFKTAKK